MKVSNTSVYRRGTPERYDPINEKFCMDIIQRHPETEGHAIKKLLREFNEYLIDTVCKERDGILLPHYLGLLFIGVFPGKSNNLTWKLGQHGKEVEYSIYDRDGFEARLFYSTVRTKARFAAGLFWGTKPDIYTNNKKRDA